VFSSFFNYFDILKNIFSFLNYIHMSYKVVPFRASISSGGNAGDVAQQVQACIQKETSSEWEFVSCGNIDATVAGSSGCFGIGATQSSTTSILVLVFKQ
jgi:hypothetical protein